MGASHEKILKFCAVPPLWFDARTRRKKRSFRQRQKSHRNNFLFLIDFIWKLLCRETGKNLFFNGQDKIFSFCIMPVKGLFFLLLIFIMSIKKAIQTRFLCERLSNRNPLFKFSFLFCKKSFTMIKKMCKMFSLENKEIKDILFYPMFSLNQKKLKIYFPLFCTSKKSKEKNKCCQFIHFFRRTFGFSFCIFYL